MQREGRTSPGIRRNESLLRICRCTFRVFFLFSSSFLTIWATSSSVSMWVSFVSAASLVTSSLRMNLGKLLKSARDQGVNSCAQWVSLFIPSSMFTIASLISLILSFSLASFTTAFTSAIRFLMFGRWRRSPSGISTVPKFFPASARLHTTSAMSCTMCTSVLSAAPYSSAMITKLGCVWRAHSITSCEGSLPISRMKCQYLGIDAASVRMLPIRLA
mmetsp:Transcript_13318/g.26303  ORF Transcript_13318/g.26303 Transcript_13318/m.26303 type:complete len:217 (+) Transcript_13318:1958-2608(+)